MCYHDALLEHFGHFLTAAEKRSSTRKIKEMLLSRFDYATKNFPEVSTSYLDNLRKLETEKIELIIEAYNKGKQWRSSSTIDVLLSELFERITNPERKSDDL